jgi:hypothetical protein
MRGGSTRRASEHTRPPAGARVRLPFFSRDLLEELDLQIALRHELLQPAVFVLEVPQPPTSRGSKVPNRFRQA